MTNAVLWGKPETGNPHARFDEWEVASAKPRRWFLLGKKIKNMLVSLASLGTVMASSQGKSETFDYESAGTLGEIRDMVLSKDNKMFALKTVGAKIKETEFPIWVGNTDNLRGAFSAPWMTNAVASCAFFRDRLYIAPKSETNFLYRVDVGTNQMPHVKSASEFSTGRKMTEPYLYATENNLYAIENNEDNGIWVHTFNENGRVSSEELNDVNGGASIQKEQIKDVVSKNINGRDNLYILTTNGVETALWLYNGTNNGLITPKEWKDFNEEWCVHPLFDKTTTIAVYGDKLLSANANIKDGRDRYKQLGFMFKINEGNGTLDYENAFLQSDAYRVSAIGSDQEMYYAEENNEDSNVMRKTDDKNFLKSEKILKEGETYTEKSKHRQGEPVHKFTTQKSGEIFGVSKDCIYRIKSGNGR